MIIGASQNPPQVVLPGALRLAWLAGSEEDVRTQGLSPPSASPDPPEPLHRQLLEGQEWCSRVAVLRPVHGKVKAALAALGENVIFLF